MFENPAILAALFAMVCFVIYLLLDSVISKKERIKKIDRDSRLTRAYDDMGLERDGSQLMQLEDDLKGFAKIEDQMMRVLGINVDKAMNECKREMLLAGFSGSNAPIHLLFYRRIVSYIFLLLGALMIIKGGLLPIAGGSFLVFIALFGAKLFVTNARQKRQKALLRSFPDGLDLLVVCVESGLALDAAVNRVADELGSAHPLLAQELGKTRLELALLNNRSQALMNLADRVDLVAYRSLAAALIQTERFGTNLTDTLRVLSDDYRQTRLMLAEEKAGRLPALMAIPLILLLLPSFMLIVVGPMVVRLKAQGGITGNK